MLAEIVTVEGTGSSTSGHERNDTEKKKGGWGYTVRGGYSICGGKVQVV